MKLSIEAIIKAVDGKCLNLEQIDKTKCIEAIATDSRNIPAESLFVPLRGERFDGHVFIKDVYDKGAKVTLTMNSEVVDARLCHVQVKDTNKALLDLARAYRQQFDIPVVGITGSVGKTSTKEMVAAVLSGKFKVHKTEGNFNNEIGLPLTLFKLEKAHEAAVIEMGMNHFGEIHNLSTTACPQIGIITNIGTSHIENLGSREGILKAKLEILDGLSQEGLLIVNGDNDLLSTLKDVGVAVTTYGLSNQNDYWAKAIHSKGTQTYATVVSPRETYEIAIEALGEHMVYNTLAAIAAAEHLGLNKDEILTGLTHYKPTQMRMHITTLENGITVIDDTYNASLDSMKAALTVLKDYETEGRKIAVLGDMFEMGDFAPKLHEEVGMFAKTAGLNQLFTIGELAECIHKGYACEEGAQHYKTKALFLEQLQENLQAGDTVLFKASRGMHFEELVEAVGKVK